MRSFTVRVTIFVVFFVMSFITNVLSEQKGKPVWKRLDETTWGKAYKSHGGAGIRYLQSPLGTRNEIFETPFLWVHQDRILPRSGIGLNMKRFMEGIYWTLNIPVEFTVNGRTAFLPAGSNVLCRAGNYHGIFNPSYTDTLHYLHTAVEMIKFGDYGVFDLNDSLTTQKVESPAPFPWALLDITLLRPVENFHGGKGTILMRKLWDNDSFLTNFQSVAHVLLPPGTSIGYHKYNNVESVYYILSGNGKITVNDYTWDIMHDDTIPCTVRDSIGMYNNTNENLEFFILTIAMEKRDDPSYTDLGDDLSQR